MGFKWFGRIYAKGAEEIADAIERGLSEMVSYSTCRNCVGDPRICFINDAYENVECWGIEHAAALMVKEIAIPYFYFVEHKHYSDIQRLTDYNIQSIKNLLQRYVYNWLYDFSWVFRSQQSYDQMGYDFIGHLEIICKSEFGDLRVCEMIRDKDMHTIKDFYDYVELAQSNSDNFRYECCKLMDILYFMTEEVLPRNISYFLTINGYDCLCTGDFDVGTHSDVNPGRVNALELLGSIGFVSDQLGYRLEYYSNTRELVVSNGVDFTVDKLKETLVKYVALAEIITLDCILPSDCSGLFSRFIYVTQVITTTNFNSRYVECMRNMFKDCKRLQIVDMSDWDTSSVVDVSNMFDGCSRLKTANISDWITCNLKDMSFMFCNCESLIKLNLCNWNTSRLESIFGCFEGCSNLRVLSLPYVNIDTVDFRDAFRGCCEYVIPEYYSRWDEGI